MKGLYLFRVWIHIRRGGREFKSPSRYLKVFRMKGLYLFRAWIHIRRGGREFKSPATLQRLLEMEVFFFHIKKTSLFGRLLQNKAVPALFYSFNYSFECFWVIHCQVSQNLSVQFDFCFL